MKAERRLPAGAEWRRGRGTHFRVWAPRARRVSVRFEGRGGGALGSARLEREAGGWHSGWARAEPGGLYRLGLGGGEYLPDPASRFQPAGPHGPSEIVDPGAYRWKTRGWKGPPRGAPVYELHVGTFSPEGTWEGASRRLGHLADLGAGIIEIMPVAEFPGRFGWGYDGVGLYAPTRLYGTPDDFRRFVDRAHALGLGVILDVVYNHFGPDGAYFSRFAKEWFAADRTEWGDSINYDGRGSEGVRAFVVGNAAYWISEFQLDGLRLDATQSVRDASPRHVLVDVAQSARAAARGRRIVIYAENETQEADLARPARAGGKGLDGLWNDDFHHSAFVALTGRREAYYSGYAGSPQELVSCASRGFLFQGQRYEWQKKARGTPAGDLAGDAFVCCLENHDQVSNSLDGRRLAALAHPGELRAMTALLLLGPWIPLLFQGQEWGASAPFLYFADHRGALARAVARGRRGVMRQFPSVALPGSEALLPDPGAEETFLRCKLDWNETRLRVETLSLHRDLLRLRREGSALTGRPEGAVLGARAFVLRSGPRLLAVNLGADEALATQAEPLLAPPAGTSWSVRWASEEPAYGGGGALPPYGEKGDWILRARSAVLLEAA